jgi:hypothetical protein
MVHGRIWHLRTINTHLTKIDTLETCFLTGMEVVFCKGTPSARPCTVEIERAATGGHNVAGFVAALLHYRAKFFYFR